MTKNIKEIGKELLGKSLNSFHRKTGLTQLEKNNEIQDGILNGILSQVDDAYIEKTEQSNVIHLDGSGDGVVVLDSVEGNTMVNVIDCSNISNVMGGTWTFADGVLEVNFTNMRDAVWKDEITLKPNTTYTISYDLETMITDESTNELSYVGFTVYEKTNSEKWWSSSSDGYYVNDSLQITADKLGTVCTKKVFKTFTTKGESSIAICGSYYNSGVSGYTKFKKLMLLEGDYTNKEINYFEGLQSSFEEKVSNEGKYEIEILMNNKNLAKVNSYSNTVHEYSSGHVGVVKIIEKNIKVNPNLNYILSFTNVGDTLPQYCTVLYSEVPFTSDTLDHNALYVHCEKNRGRKYAHITTSGGFGTVANQSQYLGKKLALKDIKLEPLTNSDYEDNKQNKIKLLINEPLRSGVTKKDKLCIIDNKLHIERNTKQLNLDGSRGWVIASGHENICHARLPQKLLGEDIDLIAHNSLLKGYCDKFPLREHGIWNRDIEGLHTNNAPDISNRGFFINIKRTTIGGNTSTLLRQYLSENPIKLVVQTYEPYYEEVTNEYGEPILLEGYENGTLYIDSTIIPTTTVRYTPKMESLNTLKEVNNNNVMLTSDINDTIVPYMMEVDLMIMEKEVALMNQKNIRKIGVEDMTSMQKRTQQMLERLIKGKSLTEQECQTRVTTYLNADKITDAQAEELMLLISEVYA